MLDQLVSNGHYYSLPTNLVSLHLIFDLIIALAYYSIPVTLFYFVHKRQDLPYASVFTLFGTFIIACGTVHSIDLLTTLWHPIYWFASLVKAVTAAISLYTAVTVFKIVPQALNLPSQSEFELANHKLLQEIEERKQVETDLENKKAFVEAMLDNLNDGIVACDRHGILNLFNQATKNFHGLPQAAISAEQWSEHYDLFLPDGKTRMPKEDIPLFRALKGEFVTDVEMTIVPKHGLPHYLLTDANPIVDLHGQQIGAVAIMHDVTAARRVQKALDRSQSIVKSFYDSAPMMMGIIQSDDRDEFCHVSNNKMVADFFNITDSEIKQRRTSELDLFSEIRRRLKNACLQSQQTNQPVQFEASYTKEADTKHFALTIATIEEQSTAENSLFSYIAQDISDRKRIERGLQESEERFRLAFEDAAVGMALVALDGLLLEVNRSLCGIVGFTAAELNKLTFQQITHAEDLDLDLKNVRRLLAGKIFNYQLQKRCIHKLGHTVWVLLSVSLVRDVNKQPQYFIAQIQDVTEQKIAETKLAQSLQEKEVMLQEIHHRVKNNLQVICSLLNLQARYLTEEKTIKAFKETQNRVKSMALVHEQLYQSHNLSAIVLSDYIKQLTDNLFRAYSMTSRIKCNLDIINFDLDLDTAVPCGLIVNEIITNAIKYAFSPDELGEISIHAASNELNSLVLSIEDNGIGLKSDYDRQSSKSLGLRLVSNLTEQLQGKYEIITEPNAGTKFIFTFNRIKKLTR